MDATSNVDVVVTSFSVAAVPLTCRGVRYGGTRTARARWTRAWNGPTPRTSPSTDRRGKARARSTRASASFSASGALRACVGVVDVAGNKASTCVDLASLTLDVSPPTCLALPALISASPTSATFAVRMSEAGTVKWTRAPASAAARPRRLRRRRRVCRCGDRPDRGDRRAGGDFGARGRSRLLARRARRRRGPGGVGAVRRRRRVRAVRGGARRRRVPAGGDGAPTLVPTLLASEPTSASFSLQHGDGSTTACWAVLETAEATSAADAPARTKEQPARRRPRSSRATCGAAARLRWRRRTRARRWWRTATRVPCRSPA